MLIARAIFDNDAETNDELSFERDDILAVLEKDHGGLEGWWLCSMRGKTGVVPANRLQVIQKIETPLSCSVGGLKPVKGHGGQTATDYDTPKPMIPRKLGGSCENLLLGISSDLHDDRGLISFDGSRLNAIQGSRLFHRKAHNQNLISSGGMVMRKRGVSCDNLLTTSGPLEEAEEGGGGGRRRGGGREGGGLDLDVSRTRDYDVPISLSPAAEQTTLPAERNRSKEGSGGGGGSPDPEVSSNRFTTSAEKFWNRDSFMADYDTPRCARGTEYPVARGTLLQKSPPVTTDHARSANATSTTTSPVEDSKLELNEPMFLASLREVQNAVTQVISYAGKWRECRNPDTKASIVKKVSVSIWKKLQTLILEFSKRLVRRKDSRRSTVTLSDHLAALKVISVDLEKVLGFLNNSYHPPSTRCSGEHGDFDYVMELVIISKQINTHLEHCNSIVTGELDDEQHYSMEGPVDAKRTVRSSAYQSEPPEKEPFRRAPAPPPTRPKTADVVGSPNSSADGNRFPGSPFGNRSAMMGAPGHQTIHNTAADVSTDYDVPKRAATARVDTRSAPADGGAVARRGTTSSVILRLSEVRSASAERRTKRDAVIVEMNDETFEILERRGDNSAASKFAPTKLVAGTFHPRFGSQESDSYAPDEKNPHQQQQQHRSISIPVDYDYPLPAGGQQGPTRDREKLRRQPSTSDYPVDHDGSVPAGPGLSKEKSPPLEMQRFKTVDRSTSRYSTSSKFSAAAVATLANEDRNLLLYYRPCVSGELDRLESMCRAMRRRVETGGDSTTVELVVSNVETLVVCAHKIVFVGDTIVRNLRDEAPRNVVTREALNLGQSIKAVVAVTKASVASSPTQGGNRGPISFSSSQRLDLLRCIDETLAAAARFLDVILRLTGSRNENANF